MMPFGPEEMPPGPPTQDFYDNFYLHPEGLEMDPSLMAGPGKSQVGLGGFVCLALGQGAG